MKCVPSWLTRLRAQERIKQADDILSNRGDPGDLEKHGEDLHQHYLALALRRQA